MYCEMCGEPIESAKARKTNVDGAQLVICPRCLTRLGSRTTAQQPMQQPKSKPLQFQRPLTATAPQQQQLGRQRDQIGHSNKKSSTPPSERLDLVEDFAERIKRARESRGWDQRTLAVKLKVGENVVKRIESGKLRPPIDLARKIEEVLGIKLLVPAVEEVLEKSRVEKYATFGEVVTIRGAEEEK